MKLFGLFFSLFALALFSFTPVSQSATFEFDPNDLIDLYDAGAPNFGDGAQYPRSIQGGSYTTYNSVDSSGDDGIIAWNNAGTGSTRDNNIRSEYTAWRDNDGGYLSEFNIWLADLAYSKGWGEKLVMEPGGNISATAADGWEVGIYQWSSDGFTDPAFADQFYAEWWTDDSTKYLEKDGDDIGEFSFTVSGIYVDDNGNGWDSSDNAAVMGEDYTVWFGGYAGNDTYAPSEEEIMYQGTLDITATPEPTTMLLLGAGMIGLAGLGRKKFYKKD